MKVVSILLFTLWTLQLYSQQADYLIIDRIDIIGNEKTQRRVIENELDYQVGDTILIADLGKAMVYNEKRLLSTALFTDVQANIVDWDTEQARATFEISVRENWYIYPTIVLEVADRNFNVWLFDQNRDLSRLNYGVGIEHINLTGAKDKLSLKFQRGYTNKLEGEYFYPYVKDRLGMSASFFKADYDEIGYATRYNKTVFYSAEDKRKLLDRMRLGLGLTYRASARLLHRLDVQYHHNSIAKIIAAEVNSDYFGDARTDLKMFTAQYTLTYDNRLFNFYPSGGWLAEFSILQEGWGVFNDYNNLRIQGEIQKHHSFSDRVAMGVRLKGSTKLTKDDIPFANNTGLGYEDDLVRGYELYVMDGSDWVLGKASVRYTLFETDYKLGRLMPIKQFKVMPVSVFIRGNVESGYVREDNYRFSNDLNNTWLLGYGPGLDIILYHTFLFSVEYNFNIQGDNNLYLKSTFNF